MLQMTSVLQHDPVQPSKASIKTEDSSAQTNTSVNTDAVTEHEHAQDLPQASRFPEQSTGNYQNIQCKQETTGYCHTTADNSGNVDLTCTCNCSDTADIHDTKEGVTVAAKYGIIGTGVSFPGEVKLIKDMCEFTVGVHSSLFSRGVIDGLGIAELKNDIVNFLNSSNEDIYRCNKPDCGQMTKDDCDIPERKAADYVQHQDKKYPCNKCGEDFISTFYVKKHILAPEESKTFLCEKCTAASQTSDSKRQVNLKTIADSGEGIEQNTAVNLVDNDNFMPDDLCEDNNADCDTTQSKQTTSERNVNVCTKRKSQQCENCGKLFYDKIRLAKHMRFHTGERPYKCLYCRKTYKYNTVLQTHLKIHTGEKSYKCTHCDKTFTHKYNLNRHLRTHTGERPYTCSQCWKTYKHDTHLKIHLRAHTGERPYKCTYCHKTFTAKQNLTEHIRTHTGEKPHKCTYCDMTFTHKRSLTVHIRTHTGEKPFKCTYCDITFTHKSSLTGHIRIHTGEKPHKCTYCDITFTHKSNLTVHIRTHTGEKPYKCTYCDMTFTDKSTLTVHIRTHTGEKPYKCTYCDMTFTHKSSLTVHIRTHTGEKPHTCTFCGKKFIQKGNLRAHTLLHTKH